MSLYEITARILVDVDDNKWPNNQGAVVTDGLNEMFRESEGFVVDWGYEPKPGTNETERNIIRRDDLTIDDYEEGEF